MTGPATESERALLGVCMCVEHSDAFGTAAGLVGPADWWHPAHRLVWEALGALHDRSLPLDPVLVLEELKTRGELERVGGATYLHTLYAEAAPIVTLEHHGRIVADAATRRRLHQAGTRITQRAGEAVADVAELAQWSADQVAEARDVRPGVDVLTVPYREFLHRTQTAPPAVIPGLLGEADRLVLTGNGGIGKSTFLAQIAICAAAGVDPLRWRTADRYTPVKVTIFDCENADHRRKTRYWPIIQGLKGMMLDPEPNLTIGGNGASFDLLNPRNALSLLRTIEHDRPQLLYIGPAYKLHNDDPDKEAVVKKITGVLDRVREMGVALITEAHPNKGAKTVGAPMSPSGSALWEWWPEYGLGLRLNTDATETTRCCKLERWRIDRDESLWPLYVEASGDPALPWQLGSPPDVYTPPAVRARQGELVGAGERARF